jgi:replication-associated recombination protein RarA
MPQNFPWPTVGNYDFYEVLSALQKTIRRGDLDGALFWATELYLSEYGSHAWKRFLVIASEDIGIADPVVFVQIRSLYDTWNERKKEGDGRLYFVDAVFRLVNAAKSRIIDHATIVYFEGERPKREIPDYAIDIHTNKGRILGRGYEHFFTEGAKLKERSLPDFFEERAKEIVKGRK